MKTLNLLKLLLVSTLVILCASVANGATITFIGVNGVNDGTDYVGPYTIQIDGTVFQTMCYDLTDTVSVNQVWEANLLKLDDLSTAYYSDQSDYEDNYQKEAWLFTQLLAATDAATMIDIQHAAWSLFNMRPFREDLGASIWRQAAQNAEDLGFPGLDMSEFRVVEAPADQPRVQGLIVGGYGIDPQSGSGNDAPEPGTYLLFGCGLIAFGLWSRRFRGERANIGARQ